MLISLHWYIMPPTCASEVTSLVIHMNLKPSLGEEQGLQRSHQTSPNNCNGLVLCHLISIHLHYIFVLHCFVCQCSFHDWLTVLVCTWHTMPGAPGTLCLCVPGALCCYSLHLGHHGTCTHFPCRTVAFFFSVELIQYKCEWKYD